MSDAARARRIGQRVGTGLLILLVSAFTVICSVQILTQVFAPEATEPELACRDAVRSLLGAVRRAREAAAASTGDERAALHRFRTALEPEWTWRAALDRTCQHDPEALGHLRRVDQLRYAEEHAVRYEALGLAGLRRKVRTMDNAPPPR